MPFKSKAQERLCYETNGFGGKVDCDEWAKLTNQKELPDHVTKPKKQTGGNFQFKNIQVAPSVDNLHNLVVASPNLLQEAARLNTKPQETVKQISKKDFNKKASILDIASNPVTALKYKLHNQEIPSNFAAGERNVYDNAVNVVNPLTYINAAQNTANRIAHPINTLNQIVDNPVQNGLSALMDAALTTGSFASALKTPLLKNTLQRLQGVTDDINYFINKPKTVEQIKPKWFGREIGDKLPENGNFNEGVYNLKRFPDYVAKIEDPSYLAKQMGFNDYSNFNFVDAMRNIPNDAPIAKVYNQFPVENNRALIMRKVEGLSPDKLQPEDYMQLPAKSIASLYENLKLLKDNNLAFDYMGDNYLYNPKTEQFQLLDINPQFPKTDVNSTFWNNDVLLNVNKNNPNLSPDMMRKVISNKLIQDYTRSLYRNHSDALTTQEFNDANKYGVNYLKSAVNQHTRGYSEFKTGGQMKNKKLKFQIAGANCGEGTMWDANTMQCVPIPENPNFPKMYEQQLNGTLTNFKQHTNVNAAGHVIPSDVLPLQHNTMGPFNYQDGVPPVYNFDSNAGTHDARGTFIPSQQVVGDAIDKGFNLDSDGVYRKKIISTDNNSLGFSDKFNILNAGIDLTSLIAGKINDVKTFDQERKRLLKARYNQSQYNPYETGVNNIPVYMKEGGHIDIKKSHEGLFTNEANAANMSVQEFAKHVLANKDKYSPAVIKRAVFAHNFAHQNGGNVTNSGYLNDSPDRFNSYNIIPSNLITMNNVSHDIMAYPDKGAPKFMKKNSGLHKFNNAKYVVEVPIKQVGGPHHDYDCPTGDCTDGNSSSLPLSLTKKDLKKLKKQEQEYYNSNQWLIDRAGFYKNNIDYGRYPVTSFDPQPLQDGVIYYGPGTADVDSRMLYDQQPITAKTGGSFDIGNHVGWNSEAGHVTGKITKKHTKPFKVNGYTKHASKENPVYEIKSLKTNHVAYHFAKALHNIKQTGGSIPLSPGQQNGQIEAEAGEILQSPQGQISKIPDTDNTHEEGGSLQSNVQRVLEDTGDKRNDAVSKILRITPTEAKQLVDFKPKGTVTHSKLYEQATAYYDKKLTKLEKQLNDNLDYIKNNGGQYAKRSLDLNLKLLQTIPTKGQLFDTIYNHQEATKQAYGIENPNQQNKFGGKVKFAIGGNPGDDVDPYKGGKTKRGSTTPTGYNNAFDYAGGLQAYKDIWKKAGLNLDSYKTNAEAQAAVYDYMLQTNPQVISDMWHTYGDTTAGRNAGFPATFSDEYLSNPENLKTLKQAYVDGMFGKRTLTPSFMPEITIQGNKQQPQEQQMPQQYKKPEAVVPSKFNEPLHWYDIAGNTAAYLDANERIPVTFEQLNRQPLQIHELNPQATISANNADFNAAIQQLPLNGVGFANQANLYANKYKANNQVFSQYDNANKQAQMRVDEVNNANKFQLDQTNLGLRDRAQQQQLQGIEAQRLSKLNALDDLFTKIAQNRKLNREGNLILQMTPYFNQNGEFNGNKYTLQLNNSGALDVVDKTTGKVVKTVSKDAYGQVTGSKYRTEQVNK